MGSLITKIGWIVDAALELKRKATEHCLHLRRMKDALGSEIGEFGMKRDDPSFNNLNHHPQTTPSRIKIGLSGALTFGRSISHQLNQFWFKLIDLEGTRGTIWEHELYKDGLGHPGKGVFGYLQERTFWHTFQGDECMIAFAFLNEDEASTIYKQVINRSKYASTSYSQIFSVSSSQNFQPGT
ncbi:hypothetical protein DFH28DRAFT_936861 [Melampsora americana]|nr:hypothetical protein DFH28DRAFT_936861 [Melampsora americana]